MKTALKTTKLNFAELYFFEDFVIARLDEDVLFEQRKVDKMTAVCLNFFHKKRFVYISQRIHNYNVNPTIYFNLNKAQYLSGIAIVCPSAPCLNTAFFEKEFSKLPFGIFVELEEAIAWAEDILENKKAGL